MKRSVGRPKGEREFFIIAARVPAETAERLKTLSEKYRIPQSQLVCNFVEVGLDLAESPPGQAAFKLLGWSERLKEVAQTSFKCVAQTA